MSQAGNWMTRTLRREERQALGQRLQPPVVAGHVQQQRRRAAAPASSASRASTSGASPSGTPVSDLALMARIASLCRARFDASRGGRSCPRAASPGRSAEHAAMDARSTPERSAAPLAVPALLAAPSPGRRDARALHRPIELIRSRPPAHEMRAPRRPARRTRPPAQLGVQDHVLQVGIGQRPACARTGRAARPAWPASARSAKRPSIQSISLVPRWHAR